MAYYLDSLTPASTRYATIPSVTFSGDFEIKVIAAQLGTSPTFIFAGSGVAGQNGIDLYRNTSGNYQLFINASSAIGTTTPVTNSITAPDTVIVRRLSGVVDLIINGVSRGTFSTSATLSVERLFHRNGWANYGRMGLYEFTIVGGGSYNTSWNASNSPSGGSAWTSSGGQVMTQAGSWPADNSEWVFYSSGASNTVTASATLPKITGSLTLNEINPSYVVSVNGQLPKITGAVALNEINPVFTVAVAGQLPKLTGSIALNQFANNRQVVVNGLLPKLTGTVTLNRIQPNNQVAVSGQLPRINASITLRAPDSYPTANPNDYTVTAYLSTDSTCTARLSESSTINAIISTETTYAARLN